MKTNISRNQNYGKIAVHIIKKVNNEYGVFYLNYYVPNLSKSTKEDLDIAGVSCNELSNFFTWFNWNFRQKKFYVSPSLFTPSINLSKERIYEIAIEIAKNIEKKSELVSGYFFNSSCKKLRGISEEEIDAFIYECSKERLKKVGIFLPEYEYL